MLKFENRFSYLREFGFSVFQLREKGKKPFGSWKQYQTEIVSLDISKQWDETQYNVGIATGKLSGIFIFDVDGDDGRKTLGELTSKYGNLPDTLRVKTHKGHHYYFSFPDNRVVRNLESLTAHGDVAKNIDIRGEGGYVVAPPSIHPDGGEYCFENELERSNILPAPEWLLELFTRPIGFDNKQNFNVNKEDRATLLNEEIEAQCIILENTPEGNRNSQLNKSAFVLGRYINSDQDEGEIVNRLTTSALKIKLTSNEVKATINSGITAGKLSPVPLCEKWFDPDLSILNAKKIDLPECPYVDVLNDDFAKFVKDSSICKCAPTGYIFAALMNSAAGLIGNTRKVFIWNGWEEVTALWFMLVGLPSCNKSPALDSIFPIINGFEGKFHEKYDEEFQKYEIEKIKYEKYKKDLANSEKHIDFSNIRPEPKKPIYQRYIINDSTIEKIAVILSENPRGLIYHRDELAGMLANLEKGGGSDRPFFLESFGGRSKSVDRMKYDSPIRVPSVLLSVIGSIQPEKLDQLLLNQPDDGLASRFLYVYGVPLNIKEPSVEPDIEMLQRSYKKLASLEIEGFSNGVPKPKKIKFCPSGRKLMENFASELQFLEYSENGMMVSHIGKLRGIAARISLILQYLDWSLGLIEESDEIHPEYIEKAIHLVRSYFIPMGKYCLQNVSLPLDEQDALLIARWIMDEDIDSFTARDILRALVRKTKRRDDALRYLEEAGWIRRRKTSNRSELYDVNPRLIKL